MIFATLFSVSHPGGPILVRESDSSRTGDSRQGKKTWEAICLLYFREWL